MEIDVEDIEPLDPPEEKEEPWCHTCHAFTDYRRKWDTYNRADMDGGSYSEIVEVPHCINCDHSMLLISTSRKLVWFVNFLALLTWGVGLLCVIILFEFTFSSFTRSPHTWLHLLSIQQAAQKIQTHSFKLEKSKKRKCGAGAFTKNLK